MIKGALVDFGGTIDTDGIHWMQMFSMAYRSCGLPVDGLREAYIYAERYLGRNAVIGPDFTFRETLRRKIHLQLEYMHINAAPEAILDFCYSYVVRNIGTVSAPALQMLSERIPLVIVSNFYGNMRTVLREFGIDRFFKDVIESSVVGVRKPDSEIFTLGVKSLGLPAGETVAIGDSPDKDMIPAATAGCRTVWLSGAGWADGAVCAADYTIHSIAELPGMKLTSDSPRNNL